MLLTLGDTHPYLRTLFRIRRFLTLPCFRTLFWRFHSFSFYQLLMFHPWMIWPAFYFEYIFVFDYEQRYNRMLNSMIVWTIGFSSKFFIRWFFVKNTRINWTIIHKSRVSNIVNKKSAIYSISCNCNTSATIPLAVLIRRLHIYRRTSVCTYSKCVRSAVWLSNPIE